MKRLFYSGMVEKPEWNVSIREGQHEGLISFETFQRIQERLQEAAKAPARADITNDFILRGSVACADCDHPLTACWSKSKTGKKHPYYMCFKTGCESYRKSIRRDVLEGDFAQLLEGMQPTQSVVTFARNMLSDIWGQLQHQANAHKKTLERKIGEVEHQVEKLLNKIMRADDERIASVYENRLGVLERERLLMREKLAITGKPQKTF